MVVIIKMLDYLVIEMTVAEVDFADQSLLPERIDNAIDGNGINGRRGLYGGKGWEGGRNFLHTNGVGAVFEDFEDGKSRPSHLETALCEHCCELGVNRC
jgi:hypothetical protein